MAQLYTLIDENHGPRAVAIDIRGPMVTRGFGRPGSLTWRSPKTYESAEHALNVVARDIHRFRMRGYTLGHRNQAFEDAILEDPSDVGRYLVYADWLIEHQDPRGQLIRLQVEHQQRPSAHLAAEIENMLQKHRIHFMPRAKPRLRWRYGFIESFTMHTHSYRLNDRAKAWLELELLKIMRAIVRHPSGFALQWAQLDGDAYRDDTKFLCTKTRADL